MDTMTTLKKWQDGYFDFMKKVEEPMVRYAGKVAEPMARYMPERPQFLAPVPKMTEFVDNGLKFRRRFVDEQATFVHKMMKAMEPVVAKVDYIAPKATLTKAQHDTMRVPQRKAAHAA